MKKDLDVWKIKFTQKLLPYHKHFTDRAVKRLLKKITASRNSLIIRSKKYNVPCNVTIEELRQLVYDSYGTTCRFCKKKLLVTTLSIDHIIPISRNGNSNIDNLQVICNTSNKIKGTLDEQDFIKLLEWLSTMPEYFQKNIKARLAGLRF